MKLIPNPKLFFIFRILFLLGATSYCHAPSPTLPTLYEYYTSGGIKTGLEASHPDHFHLNGKPFIIYSGSLHYFRVVPAYWRQTLLRFKAAGLNSVQLYLPWNLHEPIPGSFDFESPALDLARFLEEIKAAELFAVVRVGPYICGEWDLGGLPSWLLRDQNMKFREMYRPYLDKVGRYWGKVFKILNQYQFSPSGGPIILLQIENEYFGAPINHSLVYLEYLQNLVRSTGFSQLLFTSDPAVFAKTNPIREIPDLLEAANLNEDAFKELSELRRSQPGKPVYVSEFWPGWFDSWGEAGHHSYDLDKFDLEVGDVLFKINGSINFYMFIGGTNFGFMNGARVVTSYDYDAPLTESGNYTDKYFETRALYDRLVTSGRHPAIALPDDPPEVANGAAYGNRSIQDWIPLEALLGETRKMGNVKKPAPMEQLDYGPGYGQSYGFILYRIEAKPISSYEITGPIADRAIFLIDGNQTSIITDGSANFSIKINPADYQNTSHRYDILVENQGRANWGPTLESQLKGICSNIKVDGTTWTNFTIFSLDFNRTYMDHLGTLDHWVPFDAKLNFTGPALYRAKLTIESETPQDTYLLLPGWSKGNVFINGFNAGRYWSLGPQRTLYIPGPLLKKGANTIEVFELHKPGATLQFIDGPILEMNPPKKRSSRKKIRRHFGRKGKD